jgi:hypothetical protein
VSRDAARLIRRVGQTTQQSESEVLGAQAGALRNPNEHAGAKFFVVVEGKHEIWPALA